MLGPDSLARRVTRKVCSINTSRGCASLSHEWSWHVFIEHEVAICIDLHAKVVFKQSLRFVLLEETATDAPASTRVSTNRICSTSANGSAQKRASRRRHHQPSKIREESVRTLRAVRRDSGGRLQRGESRQHRRVVHIHLQKIQLWQEVWVIFEDELVGTGDVVSFAPSRYVM
jgi:hypothetical protein